MGSQSRIALSNAYRLVRITKYFWILFYKLSRLSCVILMHKKHLYYFMKTQYFPLITSSLWPQMPHKGFVWRSSECLWFWVCLPIRFILLTLKLLTELKTHFTLICSTEPCFGTYWVVGVWLNISRPGSRCYLTVSYLSLASPSPK